MDATAAPVTLAGEFMEQMGLVLSVTTGFIVATAWNKVSTRWLEKHENSENLYRIETLYALLVTVVAVLVMTLWIFYVHKKASKK